MKKVVIIGGAGTIGTILSEGMSDTYEIIVCDKEIDKINHQGIQIDATNYKDLLKKIPKDTDVIINLLATETNDNVEEIDQFNKMIEVFLKASYYILDTAYQLGIPKVVYASSNHVTDIYEENGVSLLGREITVQDYPYSKGLYGVLKLASENFGHLFAEEKGVSVINLRIASVPKDEIEALHNSERLVHTLLSREDVIQLFKASIEADIKYGTYYGVSDNPGKPWDMKNTKEELHFKSNMNSSDVLHKK